MPSTQKQLVTPPNEAWQPEKINFSYPMMRWAVYTKQMRRKLNHGLDFNCRVINGVQSFNDYLAYLANTPNQRCCQRRQQLIVRMVIPRRDQSIMEHWLALDVQRNSTGRFSFILLDSALMQSHIFAAFYIIQQHFKQPRMIYLNLQQQKDYYHCAVYAFDFACQLAKLPYAHQKFDEIKRALTHIVNVSELEQPKFMPRRVNNLVILQTLRKVHYVNPQDLPFNFMPLIRNTQSYSLLQNYFNPRAVGNSKKVPLEDYVNKRRKLLDKGGRQHVVNAAIEHKRNHIKNKVTNDYHELNKQAILNACFRIKCYRDHLVKDKMAKFKRYRFMNKERYQAAYRAAKKTAAQIDCSLSSISQTAMRGNAFSSPELVNSLSALTADCEQTISQEYRTLNTHRGWGRLLNFFSSHKRKTDTAKTLNQVRAELNKINQFLV